MRPSDISVTQMRCRNNPGIMRFTMILKIKVDTVSVTDIFAKNSHFSSLFAAEELEHHQRQGETAAQATNI